jgi:hypothetical protein
MTEIASLAGRVQQLEDQAAVADAARRIGWLIDHGTVAELRGCLAADAVIESLTPGGDVRNRYEGEEGLQRYCAQVTAESSRPKMHVINIISAQVSGDTADLVAYYVRLSSPQGEPQLAAYGHYFDSFRRDGAQWLLAHRQAVRTVSLASYK